VISFAGLFRRKERAHGHETAQGETNGAGATGCAQNFAISAEDFTVDEQNFGAPSRCRKEQAQVKGRAA